MPHSFSPMQAYLLRGERVESIPISKISSSKQSHRLVWVRAVKPEEAELLILAEIAQTPVEEFKEFMEEDERPRLDVERTLQVIYSAPYQTEDDIYTVPMSIFINKNVVVTVEKEQLVVLDKMEEDIAAGKLRFLFRRNAGNFLYYLLDKTNDRFLRIIDTISERIELFTERTAVISRENMEKVYAHSVTLSFFNQALLANIEMLNSLRKLYFRSFTRENKEQFAELYYDALQILDAEKIQREVVTNLFQLQSIIAGTRLNNFMKRLTALGLVILIPTFITGLYGMNVVHMPLADHPLGFYWLLLIIMLITILILFLFQKLKWL